MIEPCNSVKIGQIVPDFEMETYEPKSGEFGKFSLAQNKKTKKWTILFFYPADYTFVCPTELADIAEKYTEFTKYGAEVISVSTDTKFVHLAWRREEKLLEKVNFPMAADPTGKISRMFGIYDDETGLDFRGTFIINPEGKLTGTEVNFYNVGRNAEELLRKVKANVYLATHQEEACPANWKEGSITLKPGAKLVGRVSEEVKKTYATV